jgi:uroporphyrinogen-III synthase
MAALPLTGCVVSRSSEIDWLDDERGNPGWRPESVVWCIGSKSAERARERGWREVVELAEGTDCDDLVARIAGFVGR